MIRKKTLVLFAKAYSSLFISFIQASLRRFSLVLKLHHPET